MKKGFAIIGLLMLVASPAYAIDITLNLGPSGSYILGEAISHDDLSGGGCGAECREVTIVNALIGMPLDTRTVRIPGTVPEYYRSSNVFSPLDAVTTADGPSVVTSFTSGTGAFADYFKITITEPFMYLVGAYDGPGGGAEVWYIGDISAGNVLYIPKNASVFGTPYNGTPGTGQNLQVGGTASGLTSWSVWGTPGEHLLPDGGATATLLGLALLGLGFIRRFRG